MKNYIITSNEYDITNRRLERLYERRVKLHNSMTNCTSKLKDVVADGGFSNDKMVNYVVAMEEIEEEIKSLEIELKELQADLDFMNSKITNIKEIKEQVFIMYFIKGMKPKYIAPLIPCGKSSVYRYIDEINSERESWEKIRK